MYDSYVRQNILSATPEELLILFYDKAIVNLKTVILSEHHHSGLVLKTLDIIIHLSETLDRDVREPFIEQLSDLYSFMIFEITRYNISNDKSILEPVVDILDSLKYTWKEAITINNQKGT